MQSVERQIQSSVESKGVITCFLSLILLVILSLVSVSLESARLSGARFLTQSLTVMARNSVMAEYSGALFDRYHIFAYNSRTDEVGPALENRTAYYINRNLQAEKQMLWTPVLEGVRAENYELLTDEKGKRFVEEAVNYMKYREVSEIAEKVFSSLGIFQNAQEATELLEVKAVAEEALSEIDYCVLELFEAVDGFVRDEDGIKQNLWGKVKVKNHFVKQILAAAPTMDTAQVNHPVLFEAVKDAYVNPNEVFGRMGEYLDQYEEIQRKLEQINRQLEEISAEDVEDDPELVLALAALGAEKTWCLAQAELVRQKYFAGLGSWKSVVSGCARAGTKAMEKLELIRTKQKLAESKVLQYEEALLKATGWLDSSLQTDLTKGLAVMKQYVGLETDGAERIMDIDRLEQTLASNAAVLSQMLSALENIAEGQGLEGERERLTVMAAMISGYSHDGLRFDYSGMNLKTEGESPVDSARELLMSGVAMLVLKDSSSVSQAVFHGAELPDELQYLHNDAVTQSSSQSMAWADVTATSMSSALATVNKNSPFTGISDWVVKEGKDIVNKTLFLSYLEEHFSNYAQQPYRQGESVLEYEQEYILCGNSKDALNLYEVIGKLILVRVSFNLIHVLCDAEKSSLAGEVALGLLGVTGLPVLVSILKFCILFVWAAEAALVETAAILQGKKLALMPAKTDFTVSFPELPLMSKTRIQDKAEAISEKDGIAFGYSEYMMLFLLLQKEDEQCAHALALIQENLALEESGFRVSQMVCSFVAEAEYLLPELFTAMPFSKRKTGGYIL